MLSSVMSRLQDRRDAAAELGEDAGFTLIELMVVLLILAILLAIAIPTFLGVTGGANDRASQSNVNTAITSLKTQATQSGQTYGLATLAITAANMKTNEPSLNWFQTLTAAQGTAANAPVLSSSPSNTVSFYVSADGNGVVVTSYSKNNNTCWYAVDNLAPVVDTGTLSYGAAAVPAGNATTAPSGAGTSYAQASTNVASGCDPGKALVGAKWGNSFSAAQAA